jgi:membrane-associated protein
MHLFGLETLFDVEHVLATYGYVGIFLVVFFESGVFFALPGDSLLFTAGLFASVSHLSIVLLIALVFVASFLGSLAGYFIGTYIEHLHRYQLFRRILSREHLDRAHAFFRTHGFAAILISRFVPVLRTFTPIAAGVGKMDKSLFVRYSLLSAALWSFSVTLLGFFLGEAFPQIRNYISYFIIGIVVVSLVPVIFEWLRTRRKRSHTT